MGSLQRLLDRYDTAVMLVSLPAKGYTPRSSADGGAGAGAADSPSGAAGPAEGGAHEGVAAGGELRWPVLYVNHAWTTLTGTCAARHVGPVRTAAMRICSNDSQCEETLNRPWLW